MKNAYKKVQFTANLATIAIAFLLGIIVVKPYLFSDSQVQSEPVEPNKTLTSKNPPKTDDLKTSSVNPIGKSIPLQDINWKDNKSTLVLYLSNTCGYCSSSGPFYQELVKKNSENKIKLVTVLPQSVDDGKEYMKKLGVNIEDIYSSRLTEIGVSATPTILLVNEDGVVSEMWRGRLSPEKENELLKRLFG